MDNTEYFHYYPLSNNQILPLLSIIITIIIHYPKKYYKLLLKKIQSLGSHFPNEHQGLISTKAPWAESWPTADHLDPAIRMALAASSGNSTVCSIPKEHKTHDLPLIYHWNNAVNMGHFVDSGEKKYLWYANRRAKWLNGPFSTANC